MGWTSDADDRALVLAHLAGSTAALAAIYDRYADGLHDTALAMLGDRDDAADLTHDVFVIAAERLGQLRDPSALRAWLFAVLRHEVYGRSRRRRRTRPVDPAVAMADRPAPPDPAAEGSGVALAELAGELRDAARGLDERDQLVLELTARQGLGGENLAAVLGVSVAQSYVVVSRMRDRVSRSLDALALARAGRRDCADLDAILAGWDGELTVLVRKRVARHVETCSTCAATRRRLGALALLGFAPVVPAPGGLRQRVLDAVAGVGGSPVSGWRDDGFPPSPRRPVPRRLLGATAAAAAVLAVAGVALSRLGDDPGEVSSATVDVESSTTVEGPGTIAVVGPPTTRQLVAPTAATTSTTLPTTSSSPPTSTTVVDEPPLPPTDPVTTTTTTAPTTTTDFVFVAPVAPDDEPPRVTLSALMSTAPCPPEPAPVVRAAVADASPLTETVLSWTGPGMPGETAMVRDPADGWWVADLAVEAVEGTWTYVVSATDSAGNTGTAEATLIVVGC